MHINYKTQGTCATTINFDYNNGVVDNIVFTGGCNGNLKAIPKLINGWKGDEIVKRLKGNQCGDKGTSCADQLARAIEQAQSMQGGARMAA
jgi:uncharacterized protein (TIGR03905 family)